MRKERRDGSWQFHSNPQMWTSLWRQIITVYSIPSLGIITVCTKCDNTSNNFWDISVWIIIAFHRAIASVAKNKCLTLTTLPRKLKKKKRNIILKLAMDSDTIWGLPILTELVCFWRNIINYNNDLKTVLAPWNAEKTNPTFNFTWSEAEWISALFIFHPQTDQFKSDLMTTWVWLGQTHVVISLSVSLDCLQKHRRPLASLIKPASAICCDCHNQPLPTHSSQRGQSCTQKRHKFPRSLSPKPTGSKIVSVSLL